jgi:hypothetical protein
VKHVPRFTPAPAKTQAEAGGDPHHDHDPYLQHRPRKHGWSQLPDRVHLGRGFHLKGRITHRNAPRARGG